MLHLLVQVCLHGSELSVEHMHRNIQRLKKKAQQKKNMNTESNLFDIGSTAINSDKTWS